MGNIPLHPLLVHFPLVLAVGLPLVLVGLWWSERRGKAAPRAWWVGVAVAGLLTVSSFVVLRTGMNEEDRVEGIVPEAALELHEERAETFLWATGGVLILAVVAGLARRGSVRTGLVAATVVASIAVAGLAVAVGHSGGSLVYRYDAARAYPTEAAAVDADTPRRERDEDDDEEHER